MTRRRVFFAAVALAVLAAGCGRPVGPVGHTDLIPPAVVEAP